MTAASFNPARADSRENDGSSSRAKVDNRGSADRSNRAKVDNQANDGSSSRAMARSHEEDRASSIRSAIRGKAVNQPAQRRNAMTAIDHSAGPSDPIAISIPAIGTTRRPFERSITPDDR